MKLTTPLVAATIAGAAVLLSASSPLTSAAAAAPEPTVFHCQVPCGIYGDGTRIDLLMEDAATIEKAMGKVGEFQEAGNLNQVVRWVTTKDSHAQHVQDVVMDYFLAQRIKKPKEGGDDARAKYLGQLERMHEVAVAAMKCKQTTDTANVNALRESLLAFSESYFSEEDMKHINEHHAR